MTLANRITLVRIGLIPFIVIALLNGMREWAMGLFFFCSFTDALDGFVARSYKQRTPLGTFLDPLADKLLLTAIFLTLAYLDEIPKWVFVIVFSRDVLIVLGWLIIYFLTSSRKIEPRVPGKFTTAFQMASVLAYLIHLPPPVIGALVWIMVASTIVSAVDYVVVGTKQLSHLEYP